MAEEWTQRAFIKAFKRIDQFNGKSAFKTWLFKIGLNEMRSDLRSKWQFEEYDAQLHTEKEEVETPIDDWMSARIAINALPSDQRMIFLLYEIEGYPHKEIADMLGISESYSRVILTRAKKDLKKHLTQ